MPRKLKFGKNTGWVFQDLPIKVNLMQRIWRFETEKLKAAKICGNGWTKETYWGFNFIWILAVDGFSCGSHLSKFNTFKPLHLSRHKLYLFTYFANFRRAIGGSATIFATLSIISSLRWRETDSFWYIIFSSKKWYVRFVRSRLHKDA